jgi:hypothetical protein
VTTGVAKTLVTTGVAKTLVTTGVAKTLVTPSLVSYCGYMPHCSMKHYINLYMCMFDV